MDEDILSEISILPDGRVYVFGMTRPLLEVLAALPARENGWQALLEQMQAVAPSWEHEKHHD